MELSIGYLIELEAITASPLFSRLKFSSPIMSIFSISLIIKLKIAAIIEGFWNWFIFEIGDVDNVVLIKNNFTFLSC